jgi:hypothetical protein
VALTAITPAKLISREGCTTCLSYQVGLTGAILCLTSR